MAKQSKLELLMELSDKLFNNKLSQVQAKLSAATDKMEGKLQSFNMQQIRVFSNIGEAFDPVKINQMTELFDSVSEKLDFTNDISNTQTALSQMDVSNIEEMGAKIHEISKIYNEDSIEIAKAANAMTKQIGGSFESNLALLQAGYEKGANLNGDMLDQFKEYGPQIKELGLDASQMLAIMANAGKQGIFSDKAIDSIKEANLSLKEMGPAQLDALKGIGLGVKDLAGKTSFEAVQMITKAMNGATAQAKQLALTDIFKGAGEDAGMSFILGLGTMELDPNKLQSFKSADEGFKTWVANLQSSIAGSVGGWMPLIQALGMSSMAISGIISLGASMIPMLTRIGLTTKIVTAAQWLWNTAMTMNPIGLIIVGIAALIGIVVVAIKHWDDWGASLMLFLGPVGMVISAFKSLYDHWESIKKAFQTEGILGGLKRIGVVLLDALLMPMQQLLELVSKIPGMGTIANFGAKKIEDLRKSLDLIAPGETDPKTRPTSPVSNAPASPLLKAPVLDGKLTPSGKKDKKTGENISKVAGQANQVRNITINVDSFNKGGINVAQSAYAGMTKDDVEAFMKEMFIRLIINAENA
ncbi:phage tail tape measure protein [Flavobacterium aquicola]|uniref:Minor tail protein n=1 Tax=Flavobacterium aquicola TaxID=1682742 RepID=A0A3E0EQ25_9FLAO|nr:phage tail tape measure protein [Flavobacterium aquicola]REH00282.1 minor tail protein [Flavobacterium aquicola]